MSCSRMTVLSVISSTSASGERHAHIGLEFELLEAGRVHDRPVALRPALARAFGFVQGQVGVTQDLLGALSRVAAGDADAVARSDRPPLELDRGRQLTED